MTLRLQAIVLLMAAETRAFMPPSLFENVEPKARFLLPKQHLVKDDHEVHNLYLKHGLKTIVFFVYFASFIILPSPSFAVPTLVLDQNEMFSISHNPRKQRAIQDLRKLKALEDSRLDMCAGKIIDQYI